MIIKKINNIDLKNLKNKINLNDIIYINNTNNIYKFIHPIKYFISIKENKKNNFLINIKVKTTIFIKCLSCLCFFSQKIISNSSVNTIIKKNTMLNKDKKLVFFKKNLLNIYKIIQEEVFYSLPFLNKHNTYCCKKNNK